MTTLIDSLAASIEAADVSPVQLPVSDYIREGLTAYVEMHRPPGGFLRAVLENDLRESVARADERNQWALCAIVSACYNDIPADCWGSPERVAAWLAGGAT